MKHLVIASSLALAVPALASSTVNLKLAGKYRHGMGHEVTKQDFKTTLPCEWDKLCVANHVKDDEEEFTATVTPHRTPGDGVRVDTVFIHRVGDEESRLEGAVLTRFGGTAEITFEGQGDERQHFSLEVTPN